MPVRISKNNKLNNALAGAERGLGRGMALGQRSRAIADDEKRTAFHEQQALRQAQIADMELQREDAARRASSDAAGEMAQPQQAPPMPKMGPLTGAFQVGGQQLAFKQQLGRVKSIAQRMAQSGRPLSEVQAFVETVKKRHMEMIDKQERDQLEDDIGNDLASGTNFDVQADNSLLQTEASDKAASALLDSVGKGAPTHEIRAKRVAYKREKSKARTAQKHRTDTLMDLDGQIEQTRTTRSGGPGNEGSMAAGILQSRMMQKERDDYEQFSDELLRDPTSPKATEFLQGFSGRWSQYKNGFAVIDKELGPITFEALPMYQKTKLKMTEQDQRIKELEAEKQAREIQDIPEAAQDRRSNADARMIDATRPRGPAAGTARVESQAQLRSRAIENIQKKRGASDLTNTMTEAEIAQEIAIMSGGGAQAPAAQKITVEQAKAQGWTAEEWADYRESGKMPKR